jgi:hypothetical protein
LVPFVLFFAQILFMSGYPGLEAGQQVLLTAHVRAGATAADVPRLETPPGIRADTDAVWFPAAQDVMWRITPQSPGDYELRLHAGGQTLTKTLHVSSRVARRSPSRLEAGQVNEILYPAEPPLPADAPLTTISIPYPEREIDVLGWKLNWLVVFFVLSIVFAFVLRKPFGVTL